MRVCACESCAAAAICENVSEIKAALKRANFDKEELALKVWVWAAAREGATVATVCIGVGGGGVRGGEGVGRRPMFAPVGCLVLHCNLPCHP